MSLGILGSPCFDFVGVEPVAIAGEPPQVLDAEQQAPVALDLLQMLAFVETRL